MNSYLVPGDYGEAEHREKRSRFIGRVWRTDSEAEALARLRETREAHRDSRHNVYAYIIRENNVNRYSDDGEPSGTGGLSVLGVFKGAGITDCCCAVTRYFGGVLLGTGGLVRAYTKAAQDALDAAGVLRMEEWNLVRIRCAYPQYERVIRLVADCGGQIRSADYGAAVEIRALLLSTAAEDFLARLSQLTSATAKAEICGTEFMGVAL